MFWSKCIAELRVHIRENHLFLILANDNWLGREAFRKANDLNLKSFSQ